MHLNRITKTFLHPAAMKNVVEEKSMFGAQEMSAL